MLKFYGSMAFTPMVFATKYTFNTIVSEDPNYCVLTVSKVREVLTCLHGVI